MSKKLVSFMLIGLLMQVTYVQPVAASTRAEKEARFAEKVKVGILKLGIGPEARVEVKLRDKRKLKGYISEASEEHFVVVDDKTGASVPVAYPQVTQAKGNNLSAGVQLAIGLGALVLLFVILLSRDK